MKKGSSALLTIFLVILVDLIGFGIILPLIPYYASTFHATPIAIGFLFSIYSLAQLIFSPIWGGLSDRIGRRPIMMISTLGAAVAYVVFALSNNLPMLFFSRLLAGIMGGNISTGYAYVADITSHEDRAKGMGLIGAAFGIGFVLGPALATILIHPRFLSFLNLDTAHKYMLPGFFACALSVLSFILVLTKLKETVHHTLHEEEEPIAYEQGETGLFKSSIFSKGFWQFLLQKQSSIIPHLFLLLVGCAFLNSFAQSSLYSAFPLYCKNIMNISAGHVGTLYVYMGVVAVIIQGVLIRIITRWLSEKKVFLIGSIIMPIGLAAVAFMPSKGWLAFSLCVMSLGASLYGPTLNSLISKEADPSQLGRAMGISQGISALARVLGPAWGGFLFGIQYRLPFLLTAGLLSFAIIVGVSIQSKLDV
ncbi:MAG: hypothetical protein COV74_04190 [Candidatus Omnitrophica bacterium CG11_big_fil_rev_8_21_14_0_20_45_26]|uniref:Major facilitator superfamily (MFS) profile domain-containing protein n=1 Tax=Candidatus Abzuiibacterium crystallinum TaxID=1974748 RepID=A0A2H0LSD1_9BACT|nr:MAG: hypothetical protein COV74_04190 [Candidatus Omnitrophica bacterium CG11_big_fil_rev_8_21_14_0_20_45_26]PIW63988.1 MAG: hypothetical protein COW12_08790 [Candidatus Omnitrophica bacterium CG12_big_fil_rev_8_21_14_0_65_45_16]